MRNIFVSLCQIPRILRTKPIKQAVREIPNPVLEAKNNSRAADLAQWIRTKGSRPYGDKWAEYTVAMWGDRRVSMQASDEEMVINIRSVRNDPLQTNIRWNRRRNQLTNYQVWNTARNTPVISYNHAPAMQRVPDTFTFAHATRRFSDILDQLGRRPISYIYKK